jgi:autotransporter translocation and assembly factor TamB
MRRLGLILLLLLLLTAAAWWVAAAQWRAIQVRLTEELQQELEPYGKRLELEGLTCSLTLRLKVDRIALWEGSELLVQAEGLEADLALWTLVRRQIRVHQLQLERLQITEKMLERTEPWETPLAWPSLPWTIYIKRMQLPRLEIGGWDPLSLRGSLRWAAHGGPFKMQADLAPLQLQLALGGTQGRVELSVALHEQTEGALSKWFGVALPGYSLQGDAYGTWESWQALLELARHPEAHLAGRLYGVTYGDPMLCPPWSQRWQLRGDLDWRPERLQLDNLSATSAIGTLSGQLALNQGRWLGNLQGSTRDLAQWLPEYGVCGPVQAEVVLQGGAAQLQLTSPTLQWHALQFDQVAGAVDWDGSRAHVQLRADRDGPVQLSGLWEGESLRDWRLTGPGLEAAWSLSPSSGSLEVAVEQLAQWNWSDEPLSGQLQCEGRWQRGIGAELELHGTGLHGPFWTTQELHLQGHYREDAEGLHGLSQLDVTNATIAGHQLTTGHLNLFLQGRSGRYTLQGDGPEASLRISGSCAWAEDPWQVTVSQLEGLLNSVPVRLKEPATYQHRVELTPVRLQIGSGWLTAEKPLDGATRLEWEKLPLNWIRWSAGLGLCGETSGRALLNESTRAQFEAEWKHLGLAHPGTMGIGPLDGWGYGLWDSSGLQLSAHSEGPQQLDATLHLPLRWWCLHPDPTAPMSGSLRASGQIGPLLEWLVPDAAQARGDVTADLTLSGCWEQPCLVGQLQLRDGSYTSLATGAHLEKVALDAEALGKELRVQLQGQNGDAGRLQIEGSSGIGHNPVLALGAQLEQLELVQLDSIQATATGQLNVTGPLARPHLEGALELEKTVLKIPEQMPVALPELHVALPHERRARPQPAESRPYTLKLQLRAKEPIQIGGRGLESLWDGSVILEGSDAKPQIAGQFQLSQGMFRFAGKVFQLREGMITLVPGTPFTVVLQLEGTVRVSDVLIEALVTGPLDNPRLTFRSEPALPTNAILALLLFNSEPSQISPFQAVQIARTLVTLSRGLPEPGFFDQLTRRLGLDELSVSTGSGDQMVIVLGKYLAEGVYVTVNQALEDELGTIGIETDLALGFHLQAEAGGRQEALLGLQWRHDY